MCGIWQGKKNEICGLATAVATLKEVLCSKNSKPPLLLASVSRRGLQNTSFKGAVPLSKEGSHSALHWTLPPPLLERCRDWDPIISNQFTLLAHLNTLLH